MKAETRSLLPVTNLFKTTMPGGFASIILPLCDKAKPEFVPTFGLLL
jgi:hypothetical protein